MRNLILPTDNSLSLAANGLLTAMVNCPEKDYSTIDELYESSNDDFIRLKQLYMNLSMKDMYSVSETDLQ